MLDDPLTRKIIECVFAVHTEIGPGFRERIYQNALAIEFAERGLDFVTEERITIRYRRKPVGTHRLDLVVEKRVLIELKSVEELCKRHYFQVRSYLKASDIPVGLLINFNEEKANVRRIELGRAQS